MPAATERTGVPRRLRGTLLLGAALLVAAALWFCTPSSRWSADADLALLLRGMAGIKGLLTACALAAVWWRLGQPLGSRLAAAYLAGSWGLALASALIWELTAIGPASALFHASALVLLILAWRDPGSPSAG